MSLDVHVDVKITSKLNPRDVVEDEEDEEMQDGTLMRLSDVSRELNRSYFDVYRGVVSGVVPAHRDRTGTRWLVDRADLPKIAKIFGVAEASKSSGDQVVRRGRARDGGER